MDEYEELLRLHLARLSREKLQRMAAMITAELKRRAGVPADDALFGGKKAEDEIQCPYDDIVKAYHAALPDLPQVRMMSDTRRGALRRFWLWVLSSKKTDGTRRAETAEQALTWIAAYFRRVNDNPFLLGRHPVSGERQGWQADLDFLLTERGRKHVIERTAVAA